MIDCSIAVEDMDVVEIAAADAVVVYTVQDEDPVERRTGSFVVVSVVAVVDVVGSPIALV